MSEDDEYPLVQDHAEQWPGEDRLEWRELGRFAPRVPSTRPRPRRDLGPGGSLVQDPQRA
jgi:hypothetical protein